MGGGTIEKGPSGALTYGDSNFIHDEKTNELIGNEDPHDPDCRDNEGLSESVAEPPMIV